MSRSDRLAALHAEAFASPWAPGAFDDLLSQTGVTAIVEDEGFILIRTVADEAEILTLAVRPAERRRGLGARLVEAAAKAAGEQRATRLFLEVAEDNAAARALYARCGFGEVGRRRAYYPRESGPAADALILARNLVG